MFRRLARTLLLTLAVLGLIPGMNEAVEQLVELAGHGHLAHSVPDGHDPLAGEHGCTPLQHHCPCHQGQTAGYHDYAVDAATAAAWLTWMVDGEFAPRPAPDRRQLNAHDDLPRSSARGPPTPPPNA